MKNSIHSINGWKEALWARHFVTIWPRYFVYKKAHSFLGSLGVSVWVCSAIEGFLKTASIHESMLVLKPRFIYTK